MPRKSKRLEYTPVETLKFVRGVTCEFLDCCDAFKGSKELLVATGVAPAHLFPGEPGMPASTVDVWPRGSPQGVRCQVDGRLQIRRNPSGKYTVARYVSEAEAARRRAATERRTERYLVNPSVHWEASTIAAAMVRLSRDEMPVTKGEKQARQLMEDLCSRHMLPQ